MINVELSGIWSRVTLPDLLSGEKKLFDAHLRLRDNRPDGPDFLGWLGQPDSLTAKQIHTVRAAAETICSQSDTLVVIGNGPAYLGAKAAVMLFGGRSGGILEPVRVIFAGADLSTENWLKLCSRLENRNFSLFLISSGAGTLESAIASRSLRWLMERRFGQDAKSRIFVSAALGSPAALMASEEDYTFLPLPEYSGSAVSALSTAALLPMTVSGMDPLSVLGGAASAYEEYDVRAFENPVWMYAGAKLALEQQSCRTEFLVLPDPALRPFGAWWRQNALRTCRDGRGILPLCAELPADLDMLDALVADARNPYFETVLQLPDLADRRVSIEMAWKNQDGLEYLAGRDLSEIRSAVSESLLAHHEMSDAAMISLECGELNETSLGELLYFFELSSALCGADPDSPGKGPSRSAVPGILGADL